MDRDTQLRQVFLPDTTGRGPARLFATNIIPFNSFFLCGSTAVQFYLSLTITKGQVKEERGVSRLKGEERSQSNPNQ